jgi:hypothetical protein
LLGGRLLGLSTHLVLPGGFVDCAAMGAIIVALREALATKLANLLWGINKRAIHDATKKLLDYVLHFHINIINLF